MFLKCEKGQHLTSSEQNVINYINDNVDSIGDMTISEIADKAFVSTATVSRAIKKCGIDNLHVVRYQISVKQIAKDNFVAHDILENTYSECKKTIERIDTTAVLKFVNYIRSANKIIILSQGGTTIAAQELETHLRWLGFMAYKEMDPMVMRRMNCQVKDGDLVVILSVANSNPELSIAAKLAKSEGANVVTCCCTSGTTLEIDSDVIITPGMYQSDFQENGFETPSLLGLHIINRIIIQFLTVS